MPATVGSSAPPGSTPLLAALPLPPSIKAELTDGGFVEVGDLAGYGAADLASILRVDEQHAQSILGLVQGGGERASGRVAGGRRAGGGAAGGGRRAGAGREVVFRATAVLKD